MATKSVSETQVEDAAGDLVDSWQVVYQISTTGTLVTFNVPKGPSAVGEAQNKIAELEAEVGGLFGL